MAASRRSHQQLQTAPRLFPLARGSCPDLLGLGALDPPLLGSPAGYRAASDEGANLAAELGAHLHADGPAARPAALPPAARRMAAASGDGGTPATAADPFDDLSPLPARGGSVPMRGSS